MKLSIKLAFISVFNIGLAFIFQWYVLSELGAGPETDAFFAGMTIPQLVLAVVSSSLMHVLVPLLSSSGEKNLRHDSWAFLVLIAGLFSLLCIVLLSTAHWWVPLTVPGFNQDSQNMTIILARIQLIGMVFTAVNGVQWGVYHAKQEFIWAELAPFVASFMTLLMLMWALPRYGIVAAAWLSTLRIVMQTALLAPGMGRPLWPDIRRPAIHQAWHRIKPLLLGSTYFRLDPVVDKFLLSSASTGSLSLFFLAQQIYGGLGQIISKSIISPMVPKLSKLYVQGDILLFKRTYYKKIIYVGFVCFVSFGIFVFLSDYIMSGLLYFTKINKTDIDKLRLILIFLFGFYVGSSMGEVVASAFYSVGETNIPMRMSMFTFTIYMPLKIIAFLKWGVSGMAIAISCYYITNLLFLTILLPKRVFR